MDKRRKTNLPFLVARLFPILCSLMLAAPAFAFDDEWSRSVELEVLTARVERGIALADESWVAGVRLSNGSLSVVAQALTGFTNNQLCEEVVAVSFTQALAGGITLTGGASFREMRHVIPGQASRAGEVSLTVSRSFGLTRLEFVWLKEWSRRADAVEFAYAGEWPLRTWGAFLHYRVFAGTNSARDALPELAGPRLMDGYSYVGGELEVPYRVGQSTVVTLGLNYGTTRGQRSFWAPDGVQTTGGGELSLSVRREF